MMHDTGFQIGTLAMNIYADLRTASILEIGSQAVNGSLRENSLPTTKYVGVDIEQGEGVDIVVKPGDPLPVDDNSFDFVLASSVFEHDSCFWATFLEMCRAAKDGGYIYINAPSNGVVHRHPQDYWRFYPDAGLALAKWAVSQGQPVTLVESFTAEREKDIWNDFVAVFRKGRITKALPKVSLHQHVPCSNVLTWKSKEIINRRDEPEDIVLLAEAAKQRDSLAEEVAQLTARVEETEEQNRRQGAELDSLQKQLVEAESVRDELRLRESELQQRQEEIAQTRSELAQIRSERDDIQVRLSGSEQQLDLEMTLRQQAEAMLARLEEMNERERKLTEELMAVQEQLSADRSVLERKLEAAEVELQKMRSDFERERLENDRRRDELHYALSDRDQRLAAHFGETAALSKMLLDREHQALKEQEKVRRFGELHRALAARPRWWAILPSSRQAQLARKKLHRLGLFDAESYLRKNPDVAQAGMDPVHHYLNHGIDEERQA